jgi:hypothetical protein
MHFTVAGQRVIATDAKQTVRIYELASGKELGKVALPDQAEGLCEQDTPAQAWALAADKTGVLIDVTAMHGEPAKQPAWCYLAPLNISNVLSVFARHTDAAAHAHGEDGIVLSPSRKSTPGFASEFMLSGDGALVAVGSKSPGTRLPMMIGISATGAPLWSRQLTSDSTTAEGCTSSRSTRRPARRAGTQISPARAATSVPIGSSSPASASARASASRSSSST